MKEFKRDDKVRIKGGDFDNEVGTVGSRGEWGGKPAYAVNDEKGKWSAIMFPSNMEKIEEGGCSRAVIVRIILVISIISALVILCRWIY